MKLYFKTKTDKLCYPLDYIRDEMLDYRETEITLYNAIPDKSVRFCNEFLDFLDIDSCGADCEHYAPCNGNTGKCRHNVHGYRCGNAVHFELQLRRVNAN